MNIEGLDYNTKRERLKLPEYGREVQNMVDHAVALTDKSERQACAEYIVTIMDRMCPQNRGNADYKQKLWDHLAIMSDFKLDIDWPYDTSEAVKMAEKPQPIDYPATEIRVRHYGRLIFELFDKLKTMPAGEERDRLVAFTANQMKRDLDQWSHSLSNNEERVASDLANFTDGKIQLDLDNFRFERSMPQVMPLSKNGKKKKR